MTTEIKARISLDGVQQVQAGLQATAAGMDKLGQSSGRAQYQNAQLSAQLQDFFVQVQAGQSPVTAFIQQGSQLSAVFGGFGNAVSAVTALITPAVVAIGSAAAVIGTIGLAYAAGAAQSKEFANSLALTGNAAGITEGRFNSLADSIGKRTLAGVGTAREALQTLISTGKLSGTALEATAGAAAALARATGDAVGDVAKRFVGLTDNVAEGARKLNEQYNFLTAAQYANIKALEEAGNKNAAVEITMRELEARANTTTANLGTLERAWGTLTRAVAGYGEELKKIGRTPTTQDQIGDLRAQIAQRQASRTIDRGGKRKSTYDAELSTLDAQLEVLNKSAFRDLERASAAAAYADQQKAAIKWIDDGSKFLDKQAQKERELAKVRQEAYAAGRNADDPELAKRIAFINDKYKETAKAHKDTADAFRAERDAAKVWASTIEGAVKLQADAESSTLGLSKAQAALVKYLESPAYSINSEEMRQMAVASLIAAHNAEELAKAQKEAAQAAAEGAKIHARMIAELNRSADAAGAQVQTMIDEARAADIAAAGNISLAEAIAVVSVERLREKQIASMGNEDAVAAIQREIDARLQLVGLIHGKDEIAANKRAADESLKVWQSAYEQAGDALYDALTGNFASAKRLIESQIIRPVVQAAFAPITSAITGALTSGFNGGAAPGTAGGSGSLSGIFSNFLSTGSLAVPYNNLAMSSIGQSLGLSTAATTGNNVSAFSQSLTPTGEMLGSFAKSAGSFASYADAFMSAKAGNWGTAAGQALGTYVAGPIGGMIGKVIGSAVDKLFQGGAGTPHMGGYVQSSAAGVLTDITAQQGGTQQAETQQAVSLLVTQLTSTLNDGVKAFGKDAAYGLRAVFEADGRDAAEALFQVTKDGIDTVIGFAQTDKSTLSADPTKAFEAFSAQSADAVKVALLSIDLPKWASDQLSALDASAGADKLMQSVQAITETQAAIGQFTDALKPLPGFLGQIGALSSDAVFSLGKFSGGLDALSTNFATYYNAFYSDAERVTNVSTQVADALGKLGLSMPASREAFRALVESQDSTTESGQRAIAALLGVSGAFDSIATAADEAQRKADELAAQVSDKRADLQIELLRAQGREQAAVALERQREIDALRQLDPALASMRQSIYDAADAAAFAAKAASVNSGVDSIAGDFLKGSDLAVYKAARIQQALQAGGIDATVPGILSSTKDDLMALWSAVGVDGKQAILDAYGAWKDLQDVLYGTSRAVAAYRTGTLADAIEQARLKTLTPADRIASLKATESTLFGRLSTADDPVAVAQQLQQTIIARISEESALRDKAAQTTKQSLQEQISAAQRLQGLSADIGQFTGTLSFSDLSPLSRRAQVGSAESLYQSTLRQAQAGDQSAQVNLIANARAYLDEAASAYASGPAFASIYDRVTRELNAFGGDIKTNSQLSLLQQQFDALTDVADNSADMLKALLSIDTALGGNAAATIGAKAPAGTPDTSAPALSSLVADSAPASTAGTTTATSTELGNQTAQLAIISSYLARVAAQTDQLASVVARQDAQLSLDRAGYLELRGGLGAVRDVLDQIKGELQVGGVPP